MARRQAAAARISDTDAVIRRDSEGVHVHGRKLSLGEIARGSGITRPHVTRIFNGKRELSLRSAQKLASFLGVSIDSLLGFLQRPS